jgi:hypothetical protein
MDTQFTWHKRGRFSDNVLVLMGDKDTHYPWTAQQVRDHEALADDHVDVPYYVSDWLAFAEGVGLHTVIIPGGAHNVFDHSNPKAAQRATEAAQAFLGAQLCYAGTKFFVGQPLYHRPTKDVVLSQRVFTDVPDDSLQQRVQDRVELLENVVARNPVARRPQLDLAHLHNLLASLVSSETEVGDRMGAMTEHLVDSVRHFSQAMPYGLDIVADLFVGRPVTDVALQQLALETLGSFQSPEELPMIMPKTKSMASLFDALASQTKEAKDGDFTLNAVVYDFENQPVEIAITVEKGHIQRISLNADPTVMDRLTGFWAKNQATLNPKDETEIRNHIQTTESGKARLAYRAPGGAYSDTVMLIKLLLSFFPLYPHPAIVHLINKDGPRQDYDYKAMKAYQNENPKVGLYYRYGKAGKTQLKCQRELKLGEVV